MKNDITNIKMIAARVCDCIERKNYDYDHAFAKMWTVEGDIVGAIHIQEKALRLMQLVKTDNNLVDESIDDALMDCAGYCLLMLDLRKQQADTEV